MKPRTTPADPQLTPARDEERCVRTGKKCFRTPALADRSARTIRRHADERMHSYRCDHCRRWHIGHKREDG